MWSAGARDDPFCRCSGEASSDAGARSKADSGAHAEGFADAEAGTGPHAEERGPEARSEAYPEPRPEIIESGLAHGPRFYRQPVEICPLKRHHRRMRRRLFSGLSF